MLRRINLATIVNTKGFYDGLISSVCGEIKLLPDLPLSIVKYTDLFSLKKSGAVLFTCLLLAACNGKPDDSVSGSAKSESVAPPVLTLSAPAPLTTSTTPSRQFQSQNDIQPQATTASFSPVTRIQNTSLPGSYFFTINNSERVAALAGNPSWKQEGPAFWASTVADAGLSPVYRFRNNFNGSYLYTIYETERAEIVSRYSAAFTYEGPAWYASQTQLADWAPLYRFRNLINGTYLFTANEAEKNNIISSYGGTFSLEGVAYYVWQDLAALSDVTCNLSNFQAAMTTIVNGLRASGAVCNGVAFPAVGALAWNSQLQQAATSHSTDMSTKDFFSHTSSNGTSLDGRLSAAGYAYRAAGENIAAGQTAIAQVVADWMSSTSGHCENIMNSSHRDIGVSCKMYAPSKYQKYWTMELGSR